MSNIEGLQKIAFCDPGCEHLNPKEHDQASLPAPHRCLLFDERLLHCQFHPDIIASTKCQLPGRIIYSKEIPYGQY